MNIYFYDIESLTNVFTLANFKANDNIVEIYYLSDDAQIVPQNDFETQATERIHEANRNFDGTCEFYDLHNPDNIDRLACIFGVSDSYNMNNPAISSNYPSKYRIVCDTDPEYSDEIHPYLAGYNSYHYDTTMLALLFYEAIESNGTIHIPTALQMRKYNDELFDSFNNDNSNMEDRLKYTYKDAAFPSKGFIGPNFKLPTFLIRKNMMMSGRHLDVARLNEKQSKVALKRLLGMLGYQILESDKLKPGQATIENEDQFLELIAYNVSDVVNLQKLFEHKTYTSGFLLKQQLLKTYPELIYEELNDTYKPDIRPEAVRRDRLTIDSSSAQFSTKSLCPYGHLSDYDVVSFMYPSEEKAKKFGIERVNVLDEAKDFFYKNFPQSELREQFDVIYNYYKSIEGKNFNASKNYLMDHGIDPDSSLNPEEDLPPELKVYDLSKIPAPNTCLPYFNKDGTMSTCFVNFSTGGIHGAEFNMPLYLADLKTYANAMNKWQATVDVFNKVKAMYPNPCDIKKNKGCVIDGVKYKPSDFLQPKATEKNAFYKNLPKEPKKPLLFKETKEGSGKYTLTARYAYTSADPAEHEDFTSYYPNLLRMLDAFFNKGLGYDRYGEIFDNKTKYGHMMKDKEHYSDAERELFSIMRNGTKLILNSASGAADANFESNIRMNNKIISMRIIGQIFTWRIGQAQTIAGAKIPSTNTDGLYSTGLDEDINNAVLAKESADIHVEIEPEPLFLISKDSNNRAEIEIENGSLGQVINASGGSLACREKPNPEKSLAHPAILDWAMTEYLICAATKYKNAALDKEFDEDLGRSILMSARNTFNDDLKTMLMFQNIIASSPGSQRFVFAYENPTEPIALQHYNRCFIMKDNTPGTYHMQIAAAKVITDATILKRRKNKEKIQQHDPVAITMLATQGIKTSMLPANKEATVVKISGVEAEWFMRIVNNDLHLMTQTEIDNILNNLDYDKYLQLFKDSFEKNWFNESPEHEMQKSKQTADAKTKQAVSLTKLIDMVDDTASSKTITAKSSNHIEQSIVQTDTSEQPIPDITDIPVPKMIQLTKTVFDVNDLKRAEHVLCMNGIREDLAEATLEKVIAALTQ